MNNKIIKIGVIGIGTVGSALINHLKSNKKVIQDISGYRFEVTSVCAKSKLKKRNCNISNIKFFSNKYLIILFFDLIEFEIFFNNTSYSLGTATIRVGLTNCRSFNNWSLLFEKKISPPI